MYYRDCEGPKVIVRKTKPFAEGNHGKVYAGRLWKENSQTHKFEDISDVAVKLSDPVKRDSGDSADSSQALEILNAADLQISVQSKNVVKGFAAFYVERAGAKVSAVTVMELITGATDLLKGRKALSEKKDKDRLAYYRPLLNGVQAIHEMGIGHLGLKPANILLDDSLPKGQSAPAKVKITDFDRAYAGREASMSLVVLNDYFTPPEKKERRPRCLVQAIDMWFLGLLLPNFLGIYQVYSPEHKDFWSRMSKKSLTQDEAAKEMEDIGLKGMDADVISLLSKVLCKAQERMTIFEFIEEYDKWLKNIKG